MAGVFASPPHPGHPLNLGSRGPGAMGGPKETFLEKIEGVELLRALEIGLKIKSIDLKGDSFSVDEYEDYLRAKDAMKKDLFYKKYK